MRIKMRFKPCPEGFIADEVSKPFKGRIFYNGTFIDPYKLIEVFTIDKTKTWTEHHVICTFYECLQCRSTMIEENHCFCPICGCKLEWGNLSTPEE